MDTELDKQMMKVILIDSQNDMIKEMFDLKGRTTLRPYTVSFSED